MSMYTEKTEPHCGYLGCVYLGCRKQWLWEVYFGIRHFNGKFCLWWQGSQNLSSIAIPCSTM